MIQYTRKRNNNNNNNMFLDLILLGPIVIQIANKSITKFVTKLTTACRNTLILATQRQTDYYFNFDTNINRI